MKKKIVGGITERNSCFSVFRIFTIHSSINHLSDCEIRIPTSRATRTATYI